MLDVPESELNNTALPVLTPTIGSNVKDISITKRKCIRLREVSGSLRQTWSQYIPESRAIVFLFDLSNRAQYSTSQIELLKLLSNPLSLKTPILLIFNKTLSPLAIDLPRLYGIYGIDSILASAQPTVKVVVADLEQQASVEIIKGWIRERYNGK